MNSIKLFSIILGCSVLSACTLPWQFNESIGVGNTPDSNAVAEEYFLASKKDTTGIAYVLFDSDGKSEDLDFSEFDSVTKTSQLISGIFFQKDGEVYMYDAEAKKPAKISLPKMKEIDPGKESRVITLSVIIDDQDLVHFRVKYLNDSANANSSVVKKTAQNTIEYLYSISKDEWEEVHFYDEIKEAAKKSSEGIFSSEAQVEYYDSENDRLFGKLSGEGGVVGPGLIVVDRASEEVETIGRAIDGQYISHGAIFSDHASFIMNTSSGVEVRDIQSLELINRIETENIPGDAIYADAYTGKVYFLDYFSKIHSINTSSGNEESVHLPEGAHFSSGVLNYLFVPEKQKVVATPYTEDGKFQLVSIDVGSKEANVLATGEDGEIINLLGIVTSSNISK